MKRIFLFIALFIFLSGCNNNDVLSKDFKSDVEQVLPVIKKAHEKQEDYSEKEFDLLDKFQEKYELGQYQKSGEEKYYEMNDVEKAIYHEIISMYIYAVEMDSEKETAVLASEESADIDEYKQSDETLEELMKINNVDDLPDEFKNKYPTYEVVDNLYPGHFKEDVKNLSSLYDPIVNGIVSEVSDKEWYPLEDFLNKYKGEQIISVDYKHNDKHYLINDRMREAIKTFSDLETGINEGHIMQSTIEDFNFIKENIGTY